MGMGGTELFDDLPEQQAPRAPEGAVRLRQPVRDQSEFRSVDLESLLPPGHRARIIWAYVEKLDLSALYEPIKAREGRPGHPPIDPRLMLALWLYATSEGVGSARALARLCESHDAYRWLCGGVSVNHHTLADFRMAHPELLDRLLAENVAALAEAGLIDFDMLAQDGLRVRASAGSGSFGRRERLERRLGQARELVEQLKREVDDDADASNRRIKAARERAAREAAERAQAALDNLAEIEAERERRRKEHGKDKNKKEPRASTSDPEARVMKMADGGFRPAYNMQIVTAVEQQIIVGVDATACGSDAGLIRPAVEELQHKGIKPACYLADGGFAKTDDVEWMAAQDIVLYCPPPKCKQGIDPYAPRADDGPDVVAWRQRMKSEAGQAVYKRRVEHECINAHARRCGLHQLTVRGLAKARTVLRWFALAHNILAGSRLAAAAAA
jgi:transposase